MSKQCIRELTEAELAAWIKSNTTEQPYRTAQIRKWLLDSLAVSFDEMANLPKQLRSKLAENFDAFSLTPLNTMRSDDGTVKWLSKLHDGDTVETVLIRAPGRTTVCVSTQVGCPVRCVFCESGRHGFVRNLKYVEILEQYVMASHENSAPVDNIVIMGAGEPMLNLDNLLPALDSLCNPDEYDIGARHITVSTSGIPQGIRRLADHQRPWNLALSLHATNDSLRAQIIPDKNRYPLDDILAACAYYRERTGRMITFEYVLLDGLNASVDNAYDLARLARASRAKVNLIPCNPGVSRWMPPDPDTCSAFLRILLSHNIQATIRQSKGEQIKAACGQLKARKASDSSTPPEQQPEMPPHSHGCPGHKN